MSDLEEDNKLCVRCLEACKEWEEEFLCCTTCKNNVHIICLANGHVPGDLLGDAYFTYVCYDCTTNGIEVFQRTNVPWLEAIVLALQNLDNHRPNLGRKGYFHYKLHIAAFLDKKSRVLFGNNFKLEQPWHELVIEILILYCPLFFTSGRKVLNEPGWWSLTFPSLTPSCIGKLNAELKVKKREIGGKIEDEDLLRQIIATKPFSQILFTKPPTISTKRRKWETMEEEKSPSESDLSSSSSSVVKYQEIDEFMPTKKLKVASPSFYKLAKYLNPFCLYENTLNTDSMGEIKLTGNVREAHIFSPHTGRVVKPYIFIIPTINPSWLTLMDQIKHKHNCRQNEERMLLQRKHFYFAYLQPELVPAINALCNQFMWSGIDVSPALEYPDFTCVVLYGKLIVAFGILVPDTAHAQSYLPFIFTRPNWRNAGIGRYMLYHLCQVNVALEEVLRFTAVFKHNLKILTLLFQMNFLQISKEEFSVDEIIRLVNQQDHYLSILTSTKNDDFLGTLVNWSNFEYETRTTQFLEQICQEIRHIWTTLKNIAIYYRFGLIPDNKLNMIIAVTSTRDIDAVQATEWCSNHIRENMPVLTLSDLEINHDLNNQPEMINVSVGVKELNRRINKFSDKACSQLNVHNKVNFIESEDVNHVSCARVDATFTKRQYSNGYAMVNQSDLSNCVSVKMEEEDCDVDISDDEVDKSIYKRLKDAEERLMNVEAVSSLNVGYWDETVCVERTSYKRKEWSIDNVDGMIAILESRQVKIPRLDET